MHVLMPQLGETVTEGKISTWFKAVGEAIREGDNLFEIETDKTAMEVPATIAGVLHEIRVPAGDTVPVGTIVAVLRGADRARPEKGTADPDAAETPPSAPAPAPCQLDPYREVRTPPRNFGPATLANGVKATPLARRLAVELGVDLVGLSAEPDPSGMRRIDAARVRAAVAGRPAVLHQPPAPAGDPVRALYAAGSYEERPHDPMRRTIARRLSDAKQTVPHFYLSVTVELDELLALRKTLNAASPPPGPGAYALSINDFIIKALALALRRVPEANASWTEEARLLHRQVDVSVAVSVPGGGLVTPVVRGADGKTLSAISNEVRDLAGRARSRQLRPEEYRGGTTSLSNLGMYGVREFAAVINPPQATILAVGAAERRPLLDPDDSVRAATLVAVTLSCDHRVVDGALGAELLQAFKGHVERPAGLLV